MDTLNRQLQRLHEEIKAHHPHVARIAVALHDADTDTLRTFLYSPATATPLAHYRTPLSTATWLDSLRRDRRTRVINRIEPGLLGVQRHSRAIEEAGFQSSYTVPLYDDQRFVGFVFFNADRADYFDEHVTAQLDLFVHIIALTVERRLQTMSTLAGGMQLLREISHLRNDETGSHLSRMAHYAGLIAREVAEAHGRNDDWVEHVRLFAPMHDIGKITTPDAILLKPGGLDAVETEAMRQHPVKGERILRNLLVELSLADMPHVDDLLAIARHHHERWDGSGYPDALAGAAIPLAGRIVAVADVFDALSTPRCYKPAWPLTQAFDYLHEHAGHHFDPDCVRAFLGCRDEVEQIRRLFPQISSAAT